MTDTKGKQVPLLTAEMAKASQVTQAWMSGTPFDFAIRAIASKEAVTVDPTKVIEALRAEGWIITPPNAQQIAAPTDPAAPREEDARDALLREARGWLSRVGHDGAEEGCQMCALVARIDAALLNRGKDQTNKEGK